MRVVAWLGILVLCLAVTGCSAFGRRGWRPNPVNQPGPAGPAPAAPAVGTPPAQGRIGLLAGRIVDGFDQKPPKSYIRVIDTADPKGAPIDVEANNEGYFTIQGLEEKKQYRLIARARDGDRFMAGNTVATASHGNLVIRISEDFVVPGTPDVPNWPGGKMPNSDPKGGNGQIGNAPAGAWNDPNAPNKDSSPVQLGTPTPNGSGSPRSVTPSGPSFQTPHRENVADGPNKRADLNFPKVVVPPWNSGTNKPVIPSCTGSRYKVDNFALNDIDGQPWEFKSSPRGQLVLVDFWGTWCKHCISGMPELTDLQARYGPWGLDVVGIAYEQGPAQEQVQQVKLVRDSKQLNYTLLMGTGVQSQCPVKDYFNVSVYPTMVLMDREGNILWRAERKLDATLRQQLENEIRNRLNIR